MEVKSRSGATKQLNGDVHKDREETIRREALDDLVLWKSPANSLYYFFLECIYRFTQIRFTIARNRRCFLFATFIVTMVILGSHLDGPHSDIFLRLKRVFFWWSWWIWLGFLSSCGFGTGLHTFVLYLGPFIADVTMSAYLCKTLNFPSPPYPQHIICPETDQIDENVSFWRIVKKVQVESILWGLGTAIGELPPYFMARGARLSNRYDEELKELEEIIATNEAKDPNVTKHISFQKKLELLLHRLIIRAGFLGILLCASIPNPLFDLAGMTCGHFLVPFWSFFGATFIGKALVKVHLQQFTVIALSSEHHVDSLVALIGRIPVYGTTLQAPFLDYLQRQKAKLHNWTPSGRQTWLQSVIFCVVLTCIISFVVSIIHAFAKNYQRRLREWQETADREMQSLH